MSQIVGQNLRLGEDPLPNQFHETAAKAFAHEAPYSDERVLPTRPQQQPQTTEDIEAFHQRVAFLRARKRGGIESAKSRKAPKSAQGYIRWAMRRLYKIAGDDSRNDQAQVKASAELIDAAIKVEESTWGKKKDPAKPPSPEKQAFLESMKKTEGEDLDGGGA